ncbi:MAG: hypothetical protein RQ750_18040 [Roseovarius sp.]|nr:hypothetical protein [Roseovarius sp.]
MVTTLAAVDLPAGLGGSDRPLHQDAHYAEDTAKTDSHHDEKRAV